MSELIEVEPACLDGCCMVVRDYGIRPTGSTIRNPMFHEIPLDYGGPEYRWRSSDDVYPNPPRTVK